MFKKISKWIAVALLAITFGSIAHYTLPRTDIVRVVETEVRRTDLGINRFFYAQEDAGASKIQQEKKEKAAAEESGGFFLFRWIGGIWSFFTGDFFDQETVNREIFYIQTQAADGSVMVYRNEDTGWGWPYFFKFDTSNLQTEANAARSSKDNPEWVAIKHYGWRNKYISIFPNALKVTPVSGPDVFIFPWHATMLVILVGVIGGLVFYTGRLVWRRSMVKLSAAWEATRKVLVKLPVIGSFFAKNEDYLQG